MAIDVAAAFRINASVNGQQQVDKLTDSLKGVGKAGETSAAQTAAAFRILPAQFTDIATQLAGGQSPFLILLQQGGQIKDSFGGVNATFKAFASVLTPMRVAIGGAAAALAVMGKAYFDAEAEISKFNKAVAMSGGYANVSYGEFNKLAAKIASSTKESIGTSRELVMGALGSGTFGAGSIEPVTMAMARYKEVSGQTAEAVIKDFATMSSGVANWAAAHNKAMGYLTLEQFKYIQALERQGKVDEAMKLNAELLDAELQKRAPQLGTLEKAWNAVGNAASSAWDKMMNIGRPDTLGSQIESLKTQIANADQIRSNATMRGQSVRADSPELAAARERLKELEAQAEGEKKVAEQRAETAAKNRKTVEEEASGLNDRKSSAAASKNLAELKANSDERIRVIAFERAVIEGYKRREQISDQDFAIRISQIRQKELAEQKRFAEERVKFEQAQPTKDSAQEIQKAQKIAEARAEVRKLEAESNETAKRAAIDVSVIDDQKSKALRNYTADLRYQNDMLALQASEVDMSSLAYRQLVEAKQAEYDITVKTRGMVGEEAAAYREAAASALQMKQSIQQANDEKSRSFASGAKSAIKAYAEEAGNMARQTEGAFRNAFKGMEDALVDFAMTGKFNFKDLANSIIKDMIRIVIQQSIMKPLMGSFGGLFGGSQFTPGSASFVGPMPSYDVGTPYVPRDQVAMVHQGEAIIPAALNKPGALGGSTNTNNVTVNVNMESGTPQVSSSGAGDLGRLIAGVVKSELINQRRPGGLLAA